MHRLTTPLQQAIEAAVALSYPEPENAGKFLGIWLSFRVLGNILGGAINLGLNVHNNKAGSISNKVYALFLALQCVGPFAAFLLPPPDKVQRSDGKKVEFYDTLPVLQELKATARLFFSKRVRFTSLSPAYLSPSLPTSALSTLPPSNLPFLFYDDVADNLLHYQFLLIVPLITQAVFSESFNGTFLTLHYTVRARALGSFVSALICITVGNLFGRLLDSKRLNLKQRARTAFIIALTLAGAWWVWSIIINNEFRQHPRVYDWADEGFGRGFANYLAIASSFQIQYRTLLTVSFLSVQLTDLFIPNQSSSTSLSDRWSLLPPTSSGSAVSFERPSRRHRR
jgi:MFS family permease